ncbi:glycine zipper 2TM domain-containing protein [Halopiger djelfimassiliensis]|uniref:glycine zipper 2TM domain-containing protein n=1 Tax=Halopiger djelfimassiliensis TaxID=1293047 RepID=UPI00067786BF|nr:glycine zipper 2TM domain-containing protein [Halopiger djelfimassiliensis]
MRERLIPVLRRARYAAIGAAVGAAIGGLFDRNAASTGGAIGGFVGALIADTRGTASNYLEDVKERTG